MIKVKGTIYKDTFSKGIRNGKQRRENRWCAEVILKNGRKVRYRSVNRQDCCLWLIGKQYPNGDIREVPGMSGYYMDVRSGDLIGIRTGFPCIIKKFSDGYHQPKYYVRPDGHSVSVMCYRLQWAVMHHVNYSDIPEDFFISKNKKGELIVEERFDNLSKRKKNMMVELKPNRGDYLHERLEEILMLIGIEEDGNTCELNNYIEHLRPEMVTRFCRSKGERKDKANLIFDNASERVVIKLKDPENRATSIGQELYREMGKVYAERRRSVRFCDNIHQDKWI